MERWPFRHRANAIQHDERHLEQSKNVQEGLSEYKQIGESDDYPRAGVEHEEAGPDPVEVVALRLDRIVITRHQRAGERVQHERCGKDDQESRKISSHVGAVGPERPPELHMHE